MKNLVIVVSACLLAAAVRVSSAETLYLADQNAQPGVVLSGGGHQLNELYARGNRAHLEHAGAANRIQSVAVARDGSVYFASGLDGYIFQLRGRRETLVHTHRGQVRDLAIGANGETLFYSVVGTPQSGGTLEDGQIFELDLRSGAAGLFANVRQQEVEHGWWGAFALRGERLYLGTIGKPSRIYELLEDAPRPVFETFDMPILGLAVSQHGDLLFAGGTEKVYAVRGGREPAVVVQSVGRRLCDVSLPPPARRQVARPVLDLPIEPAAPQTDDDVGRILGKFQAEAEDRWGAALLFGPDDRERLAAIQKVSPRGDFRFDGLPAGRYWVLISRADLDLAHVLRPAVIEIDAAPGSSQLVEFRLETR